MQDEKQKNLIDASENNQVDAKQNLLASMMQALSDMFSCCANDVQQMHWNYVGAEFDTMHKKVLQEYYDRMNDDCDWFAEAVRQYGAFSQNRNGSAERIGYASYDAKATRREDAVLRTSAILDNICEQLTVVFGVVNKLTDCCVSIGVANYIQTRLEYWAKEFRYFNENRKEAVDASSDNTIVEDGELTV